MHNTRRFAVISMPILLLSLPLTLFAQGAEPPRSSEHDGRWMVQVTCDDVKDTTGVVKGYSLTVPVEIRDGVLSGNYQTTTSSQAALTLTGSVLPGGALRINAKGTTGSPEYSVGKVAPGRPYSYTMTGHLQSKSGEAVRQELRPCRASLTKT